VKYEPGAKSFPVKVLDRGLSIADIGVMSQFAFNDGNNATKSLDYYNSYGGFLRNVGLSAGDVRKTWRMKADIVMPGLPGAECLSFHVRYSYQGKFSYTGDTYAQALTACTSGTGSFPVCREFTPSIGRASYPAMPADDAATVTFDWWNWGLVWKSSDTDHGAAASSPPKVTVTDVRPGTCS
jgi:hypothetical protein